jgi:AraC-like DNA-binding protein
MSVDLRPRRSAGALIGSAVRLAEPGRSGGCGLSLYWVSVAWAIRPPHPVLQSLVSRYIGYQQDNVALSVHRGLPSRHVTLIISLQDPVRTFDRIGPLRMQGLVGGLRTKPALISQDRAQCGIHLELHPFGVRTLFGFSAAELTDRIVGLDDLGWPALAELPDRLASTLTWSERFDILDDVLAARASGPLSVAAELGEAWRRMLRTGGLMHIADLANEIGWSRRHFGERFRAELGLAPKQAARVLRFERAGALLRRGHLDLAGLAVECGYYDQAHLSNEWRTLAGCSPRTWILEELPFLQDDSVFAGQD